MTTPETTTDSTKATPDTAQATDSAQSQKAETDWKAEARKWERLAKDNKSAADKLIQFEESQKTEAQKLADRATTAEKERDEARLDALRSKVGAAKKLPADVVDLLKGSTEEELAAHADRLAEHFKATLRPAGAIDQGTRGGPTGTTPRDQFAEFINKQMGRSA